MQICPSASHEGICCSRGVAPLILNLGYRWGGWSASCPDRVLLPGEETPEATE